MTLDNEASDRQCRNNDDIKLHFQTALAFLLTRQNEYRFSADFNSSHIRPAAQRHSAGIVKSQEAFGAFQIAPTGYPAAHAEVQRAS